MRPWLGAIADDVTGATDLASYLVAEGVPTELSFGVPPGPVTVPEHGCLVVALKTRSVPAAEAVQQSVQAARRLLDAGVPRLYFKFCSTFDSTAEGNIGPVAAALAELVGSRVTLLTPSAPAHRRTVYKGHLFVGDQLLHESPMRHHPVNPMTDANLLRLLRAQTAAPVALLDRERLRTGGPDLAASLAELTPGTLLVVDAITDDDLMLIAGLADDLAAPLVAGSAGLVHALARAQPRGSPPAPPPVPDGPFAVIAGSRSAATTAQVAAYERSHPSYVVDPVRVADGEDVIGEARAFLARHWNDAPLVRASADVATAHQALGVERSAAVVEQTLAACAAEAVAVGMRRILVAGGETAGAVIERLRIQRVRIGASLDPGVCWCVTVSEPALGLVLKSGNFGSPDLFARAAGPAHAGWA